MKAHVQHGGGLRSCRNILVVKLDYIGDWVLCTPFLEQLRRRTPDAQITAVVSARVYPLAAACPYLDRVVSLIADGESTRFAAADTMTVSAFLADYCTGRFDLAIVPRWDADFADSGRIAAASGARQVIGFSEVCTERKRVLCRGADRFYTRVVERREPAHEAEQNLHLFPAMGEPVGMAGRARVDTVEIDDYAAAAFLRRSLGHDERRILAIAPFASEAKRMLPPSRLLSLCRQVSRAYEPKLVIVGAPEDAAVAEALVHELGPAAASACGKLTLRQSAALLRRCSALIGMDSGPAHVAAALDVPVAVVSCHSATGDGAHENSPRRFGPWGDPGRVLVLQPPRALPPCTVACAASEPHCILGISPVQLGHRIGAFIHPHLARNASNRTLRH